MSNRSAKIQIIPLRFGVSSAYPVVKLSVVLLALRAAVRKFVIAQKQLSSPARGAIRSGAVRRKASEDGHVAGFQLQVDAVCLVDQLRQQFVILAVFPRQGTILVIAGKNLRAAVVRIGA